jgi:hypothetical protein
MSTDPEFLAMRTFDRVLKGLPDTATRQRVINWVVSKTYDNTTKIPPVIPETVDAPAIAETSSSH